MFGKFRRRAKDEKGQSMLEFAIVMPIFMLLIAIILDFGWLFYNQIQMENSARNAARVACVDYRDVCVIPSGDTKMAYDNPIRTFKYNQSYGTWSQDNAVDGEAISDTEALILQEVKNTIPSSITDVEVSILYSYDKQYIQGEYLTFKVENRSYGDVTVLVKGTHHAISPLVGWGQSDGTTMMERRIGCKSVYKVEKISSEG